VAGSQGTGLIGVLTCLTGLTRNSGRSESTPPHNKVVKKKPSFAELLEKYQRIAEANQLVRKAKVEFFITKSKEASTTITLVFIIYSIDACAMDCIFRYE
jgi:hypothetical protein